jgi:hypothetical protein
VLLAAKIRAGVSVASFKLNQSFLAEQANVYVLFIVSALLLVSKKPVLTSVT